MVCDRLRKTKAVVRSADSTINFGHVTRRGHDPFLHAMDIAVPGSFQCTSSAYPADWGRLIKRKVQKLCALNQQVITDWWRIKGFPDWGTIITEKISYLRARWQRTAYPSSIYPHSRKVTFYLLTFWLKIVNDNLNYSSISLNKNYILVWKIMQRLTNSQPRPPNTCLRSPMGDTSPNQDPTDLRYPLVSKPNVLLFRKQKLSIF